jgi:hypothetical protein
MAISFDQAYPVLYQGWDRTAAQADFNATGGTNKAGYQELMSGSGGGGGVQNSSNAIDTARQLLQFQQQANQPAIQSLQASIPETSAKFAATKSGLEAQKQPLDERYQNLLNSIKGNQQTDIAQQELTTSREFGRRGIPTTSGLFEQTIGEKTRPINQYYTGQTTEAGISNEENLMELNNLISSLTGQETDTTRAIQNAIAQLQAGDSSGAITQALEQLKINQSAQQSADERAWKEKVYSETTLPESYANIANLNSTIANRNTTTANSADDATSSAINSMMTFSGGDKSKMWQWIHTYEPEFGNQGVNSSRLWAIYNNV